MRLVSILIFLFSSIVFAKKGEIVFPSAVEVSPREQISLYDLVETKSVSEEQLDDLKSKAIEINDDRIVRRNDLVRLTKGTASYLLIPAEMKILKSKQNVSRMELERKIKNKLLANCAQCDFQVRINSVPNHIPSDWALDLNVDLGKKSVLIPIFSESQPNEKGWVAAEVVKYAMVPVLNQSIKVGDLLNENMLVLEKRQISPYADTVTDLKTLVGMQATRFLTAGQTISVKDRKKEMILKKGQIVKARVGKTDYEVSIMAMAEEAGAVGDVIKVKNIDSQKLFAAKVVDRGLVEIE